MKNKVLQLAGAICAMAASLISTQKATAQTVAVTDQTVSVAPTLITQPVDQNVGYGTNAAFSVVAGGSGLIFQWRKNGVSLADFDNVAGATARTFGLVGGGGKEGGRYTFVVSNDRGAGPTLGGQNPIRGPPNV